MCVNHGISLRVPGRFEPLSRIPEAGTVIAMDGDTPVVSVWHNFLAARAGDVAHAARCGAVWWWLCVSQVTPYPDCYLIMPPVRH